MVLPIDRDGKTVETLLKAQKRVLAQIVAINTLPEHTDFITGVLSPEAMYDALIAKGYNLADIQDYAKELLS